MCDMAEVYGIYDMRSLPVLLVATFALGLNEDSRIKRKLNNRIIGLDTMLVASILDKVNWLVWSKTEDARSGVNHPRQILSILMGEEQTGDYEVFSCGKDFEQERKRLIKS